MRLRIQLSLLLVVLFSMSFGYAQLPDSNGDGFPDEMDKYPKTWVEWEGDPHDFGLIPEGEKVVHEFKFKNVGEHPLRIFSVKPSCGCTTPEWTQEIVPPGGEGSIKVEFDSMGKMGLQRKSVTVIMNSDPAIKMLNFSGDVQAEPLPGPDDRTEPLPPAKVEPPATQQIETGDGSAETTTVKFKNVTHDFGVMNEGEKKSWTYNFTNTGNAPLVISDVKPSCGCTTPDWSKEPIPPGGKGFVTIVFDSKGKPGNQRKLVTMIANTNPAETSLHFSAQVVGAGS